MCICSVREKFYTGALPPPPKGIRIPGGGGDNAGESLCATAGVEQNFIKRGQNGICEYMYVWNFTTA
jgi:hypothetical protein